MPIAVALPLLKLAAPLILKGLGKFLGGKSKIKAAKESDRAQKQGIENRYKSDYDNFENQETGRLGRTTFASQQLQGARALSPEVIAAALQRRKNTAYKGSAADSSKGMGTAMLGDAVNDIGDLAGSMNRESAIANAEAGGGGGGILAQSSQVQPVSFGGQAFDFRKREGDNF